MSRRILLIVVAMVLAVFVSASQAVAQQVDVIRGQIAGPDNAPIESAYRIDDRRLWCGQRRLSRHTRRSGAALQRIVAK